MKTKILAVFLVMAFSASAALAGMRCGRELIDEGTLSFIVLKHCGEPTFKEDVGFRLSADRSREYKIERWIYGPEAGYYTVLTMEGGVVVKVESVKD